jgi:uncharacterized Zn finger protein
MKFGLTWWGKNWLNSLNGVYFTNRIPRGKTYANSGKVYDINIEDNQVSAKVIGKYEDYYNAVISFRKFTEEEKNIIINTINNSEAILA